MQRSAIESSRAIDWSHFSFPLVLPVPRYSSFSRGPHFGGARRVLALRPGHNNNPTTTANNHHVIRDRHTRDISPTIKQSLHLHSTKLLCASNLSSNPKDKPPEPARVPHRRSTQCGVHPAKQHQKEPHIAPGGIRTKIIWRALNSIIATKSHHSRVREGCVGTLLQQLNSEATLRTRRFALVVATFPWVVNKQTSPRPDRGNHGQRGQESHDENLKPCFPTGTRGRA